MKGRRWRRLSALKYWVWLSSLSGVGAKTAGALLRHFGAPEKIYSANENDYIGIEGLNSSVVSGLINKDIEPANKILSSCVETGCRVITLQDADYPERLRNIYDPPIVLYVRGNLPNIDDEAVVGIVGTRRCTPYGVSVAENTAYNLARRGLIIATGLAKGVDSAAARGALRGGGLVLGVIGSGIDIVYPAENKALFEDVAGKGAVISEYPPGTPPVMGHFPARNRIISGLSVGVAVIEAPKRSGALITAARALEQGRDVFALPGNVDARSCEGSNALLREGAIPFLSADDIINEYVDLFPDKITDPVDNSNENNRFDADKAVINEIAENKKVIDNATAVDYIDFDKILNALTGDEKTVAETIGGKALHIDDIIIRSGLPAHVVLTAVTMLEIKGSAARGAGGRIQLKNPE